MIDADDREVQADLATMAALNERVHDLDTHELTTYATSLGVRPPDDRPGWYIVLEYAPDLTERGLFWVGPDDE
ncbi:hypothetical protein [Polymorphospora rubra]|uniref:Uncharacterized protein n=1 Tax=Polymorphospora rubra TaxID=338584 RepID=A0A810N9G6_9ACTN|nr:hypothetical protein [Polymorphospora rubra]BCJ68015.1 hypothetical protein Prubr_50360 [Polymorphospora rubra]